MALTGNSRHKIMWVDPAETIKTPADEIDDLLCAPCLRGIRKGSCGKTMVDQIRMMFRVEKGLATVPEYAAGQLGVYECWQRYPKEYAKELEGLPPSSIDAVRRVAAGAGAIDDMTD